MLQWFAAAILPEQKNQAGNSENKVYFIFTSFSCLPKSTLFYLDFPPSEVVSFCQLVLHTAFGISFVHKQYLLPEINTRMIGSAGHRIYMTE